MKKDKFIEVVTFIGILTSLGVLLVAGTSCSMKFYKQSPADVRKCCDRVNAHSKEMDKFNRYCKVALFLANSENNKEVGSGVRKAARDAVNVCKFVFNVNTDEDLLSAGDQQDYYKVRSYVIPLGPDSGGWNPPNCDPSEIHCEEF
jgi:hypothetical protein